MRHVTQITPGPETEALRARPFLVKPSAAEAQELTGVAVETPEAALAAAAASLPGTAFGDAELVARLARAVRLAPMGR